MVNYIFMKNISKILICYLEHMEMDILTDLYLKLYFKNLLNT